MSREDHEETRRHIDVVVEGLRCDIRQVTRALAASTAALERSCAEISRSSVSNAEMADDRSEAVRPKIFTRPRSSRRSS
jgi:hypothetical protein